MAVVVEVVGALLASSACLVIYRCRLKRCGSLLLQLCCLNSGREDVWTESLRVLFVCEKAKRTFDIRLQITSMHTHAKTLRRT